MPKTKRGLDKDENANGPSSSKKLKLKIMKQPSSQNPASKDTQLTLFDLPPEILEKIIGNINIWHHNRIRATSTRLKNISDDYVMHEFRRNLAKNLHADPFSYESAVLKTIQMATDVYVHSGFQSLFCGCILPMLRWGYKNPFCPDPQHINKFLLHFYKMVEMEIGDSTSQKSRLLYNLTLLRLLKTFSTLNILSTRSFALHWQAVVELKGSWLGILWKSKCRYQNTSHQKHLLVILAEHLLAHIAGKAFKRVWECGSQIYVFGTDVRQITRGPRTLFTLTFYGSKKISSLLSKCLEDDPSDFVWLSKWPNDQFTMDVDIICKEAIKWGCSKSHNLQLSPFGNPIYCQPDSSSSRESLF